MNWRRFALNSGSSDGALNFPRFDSRRVRAPHRFRRRYVPNKYLIVVRKQLTIDDEDARYIVRLSLSNPAIHITLQAVRAGSAAKCMPDTHQDVFSSASGRGAAELVAWPATRKVGKFEKLPWTIKISLDEIRRSETAAGAAFVGFFLVRFVWCALVSGQGRGGRGEGGSVPSECVASQRPLGAARSHG